MAMGTTTSPSETNAGFVVVIDSREQRPYRFRGAVTKPLPTGDYSIAGLEDRIAIERKSKKDAYASLGHDRARFLREVERLSQLEYAAIVIEASLPSFLQAPEFTRMSARSAVRSLLAWSVRFGVPVLFAGDRRHGRAVTLCLLEQLWRYRGAGTGTSEPPRRTIGFGRRVDDVGAGTR